MEFLGLLGIGLLITLLIVPWVALHRANAVRAEIERIKFDLELLAERLDGTRQAQQSPGDRSQPQTAHASDQIPETVADPAAIKTDEQTDERMSVAASSTTSEPPPATLAPQRPATNNLAILAAAREFEPKSDAPTDYDTKEIEPEPPYAPPEPSAFELQLRKWLGAAKEWLFGGNLVAKVGLLILFIGVAFLIRLASNYISVPIELRLAGVAAGAIALLVWAWRIRDSRRGIALPAQGAALAILMLVTFGAFKLFHILPGGAAFALLFVLIAFTCVLAVLQDALWLAVFGISGGFAAPILTSTGGGSHIALFSYYTLLNAGVLVIALKKSWRLLNVLGFAFTFVVGAAWGEQRYIPEQYLSAQLFLVLFWLFYIAIAVVYAWRRAPELKSYVDGTLVFGVPMAGMALQYGLVKEIHFGMAISALSVALTYATVASALWRWRQGTLRLLVESFLALAIVFGTLAIPLALDGRWTSAAWAVEGAAIVWIGLKQRQTLAWQFGIAVQLGSWIAFIGAVSGLDPIGALRGNVGLSFLLLGVTGVLLALMFRRSIHASDDSDNRREEGMRQRFGWLASGFICVAAIWLLLGMWVEVWLRLHGAQRATLLVATALILVYGLQFLGKKSAWRLPNALGNAVAIVAGVTFILLMLKHMRWPDLRPVEVVSSDATTLIELLRNSSLLGGLMLCGGALVSAFSFKNHADTTARTAKFTTSWYLLAVFWWCGFALHGLAHVIAFVTASQVDAANWYGISFWAAYGIGLALSALAWTHLADRKHFPHRRQMQFTLWPALTAVGACIFFSWVKGGLAWTTSFGNVVAIGSASDAFINLVAGPLSGALILCWLAWRGAVFASRDLVADSEPNDGAMQYGRKLNLAFWITGLGLCWYGLAVDVAAQFAAHLMHALGYPNSHWLGAWGYPQSGVSRESLETSKWWQLEYRQFALLLATASAMACLALAKRVRLEALRWLASPAAILQAIASMALLASLYLDSTLPSFRTAIALLGCWLGIAWCLQHWRNNDWPLTKRQLKCLHLGRVLTPWLAIPPLIALTTSRWLYSDDITTSNGWIVNGMWSDYLAAWAGVAITFALLHQAKRGGWPLEPLHEWYKRAVIPFAALWSLLLAIYWNLRQNGDMAPLPYLPILNPLDLTSGLVALLTVAVARANADSFTLRLRAYGIGSGATLAFGWFNLMLLRTAAHYVDIPYRFAALYHSQFVQAMLSIVWTLAAFALMRYAARLASKTVWMIGAALLTIVVAKLFLVDLSNAGSIARVVSFIGVGGLMLSIGYLAPLPRQKTGEDA